MKILSAVLSTALLVFLAMEAVVLHKRTVCRQDAWALALNLHTRALLTIHSPTEREGLAACRILVSRKLKKVSWIRLPVLRSNVVPLTLEEKL